MQTYGSPPAPTRARPSGKKGLSAAKKDEAVPIGAALMPRGRPEETGRGAPRGEGGQVQAARSPSQEGRGILDISRVPGVACPTVRDWQVRMCAGSLNTRLERGTRMSTGRILRKIKRRLGRDLSRYGYEAGSCQIVMIQDMPYKKFGMRSRAGTLGRALKMVGHSYHKPGPVPHNAAAPQGQERFRAETNRAVSEAARYGFAVLSRDELHARLRPDAGCRWWPAHGRDTVKTIYYSGKSVSVFGVLGFDSLHVRTVDACSYETFKRLLRATLRSHPGMQLIPDNASCRKYDTATDFVKASGAGPGGYRPPRPASQPDEAAAERPQGDARGQAFRAGQGDEGGHRGRRGRSQPDASRRGGELSGGRAITRMITRDGDRMPPVENLAGTP